MRTLFFAAAAALALGSACINWDDERRAYCLDGGTGCRPHERPDAGDGEEDGDGGDSGVDAGFDGGDPFTWDGGRVIRAVAPASRSAVVGREFADRLEVELIWEDGGYASDVEVVFYTPDSDPTARFNGTVYSSLVSTNSSGRARSHALVAGNYVGDYRVIASADGFTDGGTEFFLRNVSGVPRNFNVNYGGQAAIVNQRYANELYASVTDEFSNPVQDFEVRFTSLDSGVPIYFGGVGLRTVVVKSDAGEQPHTNLIYAYSGPVLAGPDLGMGQVRVEIVDAGLTTEVPMRVDPGPPFAIVLTSPAATSAPLGGWSPPITFHAVDAEGYRIPYGSAYAYAPDVDADPRTATCVFDVSLFSQADLYGNELGTFSTSCRASNEVGTFNIQLSVGPATTNVQFTNTEEATGLFTETGTGQSTVRGDPFPELVAASVRSSVGRIANALVEFNVRPGGSASATFPDGSTVARVFSDAAGLATAPALTANNTPGTYTVEASLVDYPWLAGASFGLENQ